ncbi:MAG: hypothetical protein LUE98_18105 [Tannerellaceae bacterium]|nr:hypothetical protein [Tannerellaceae bacterium]
MKRHITLIILLLFIQNCFAGERDDLLNELDKTIRKRSLYMELKEKPD